MMGSACTSVSSTSTVPLIQSSHSHSSVSRVKRSMLDDDDESSSPFNSYSSPSQGPSEGSPLGDPSSTSPTVISMAPPPIKRPTPVDPKLPRLAELPVSVKKMVSGRLNAQVKLNNKVITIFHCANFTDSTLERDILQQQVYPKLQQRCLDKGCFLRVIDVHWGMRDEFQFAHSLLKFNLQHMKQLADSDKHAILTIFLNDKYGIYWCPFYIGADDLGTVMKKVTDDEKNFLLKWYKLDEHRKPHCYVLQPIDSLISKYKSTDMKVYKDGYREWEKDLIRLRNIFCQAAPQEFQRNYFISGIEEMLNSSIFSAKWSVENVIWLKRSFSKLDFETVTPSVANYVDFMGERLGEYAQNKLKTLGSSLGDKLRTGNIIESEVLWHAEGLDPGVTEHDKYLKSLCQKYERTLEGIIDQAIKNKKGQDMLETRVAHRGVCSCLLSDLLHSTVLCQSSGSAHHCSQEKAIEDAERYISTGHILETAIGPIRPAIIHGATGGGKSSVAALLVHNYCSIEGWTGAICVARMDGGMAEFSTLDQLLLSVTKQLCLLAQVSEADAVHQGQNNNLSWLFSKVSTSTPLLVVLDCLEALTCPNNKITLDWLPVELPSHVRVCLTVTSGQPWHQALQQFFPTRDNFIEISHLNEVEVMETLDIWLAKSYYGLPELTQNQILEGVSGRATPLSINLIGAVIILTDGIDSVNRNGNLEVTNDFSLLANTVFKYLEEKLHTTVVMLILSLISCSRHGVGDIEMEDLLSLHSPAMEAISTIFDASLGRAPPYIWLYVKNLLQPFLIQRSIGGVPVTKWRHRCFDNIIWKRYPGSKQISTEHMLNYFNDNFRGQGHSVVMPQPLKWKNAFNVRQLDEIPYLLYSLHNVQTMMNQCIFQWSWVSAKLSCLGIDQLLCDLLLAIELEPLSKDLHQFQRLLTSMELTLAQCPMQFAPLLAVMIKTGQLSTRKKECPQFNQLCAAATEGTQTMLWPPSLEVLTISNDKRSTFNSISGLFRIETEPSHLIATSIEGGIVKIINIFSGEVVRTLIGLDKPKDAKMCAAFKAVFLCNRELKVIDLDRGSLQAELKGVLNIKMPYYGIHDQNHSIALARNRMYVNMMSNTTGEMITTFKVGEDRFLDSLIVSRNGNICVCGDAVQKPFPLLVWDLHNRKLIYDLRIQGHEFLTHMSAISHDGHFVVSVSRELEDPDPNFLIVYDLQSGSVFKKWKPDYSVTSVAISGASSYVISGHEDGSIRVWDLIGGSQLFKFEGHSHGPDSLSVSENGMRCVSYDSSCTDTSVWAWDLKTGGCLGSFTTLSGVLCAVISADGSLMAVGLQGCPDVVTLTLPGPKNTEGASSLFGDAARAGQVFDLNV